MAPFVRSDSDMAGRMKEKEGKEGKEGSVRSACRR
jgi:hypothetical protein